MKPYRPVPEVSNFRFERNYSLSEVVRCLWRRSRAGAASGGWLSHANQRRWTDHRAGSGGDARASRSAAGSEKALSLTRQERVVDEPARGLRHVLEGDDPVGAELALGVKLVIFGIEWNFGRCYLRTFGSRRWRLCADPHQYQGYGGGCRYRSGRVRAAATTQQQRRHHEGQHGRDNQASFLPHRASSYAVATPVLSRRASQKADQIHLDGSHRA
jgi:hypothetical protein